MASLCSCGRPVRGTRCLRCAACEKAAISAKNKAWSAANASHKKAAMQAWHSLHGRERYASNWAHQVLKTIRQRAKRRGLEFNIEPSDIPVPSACPVLGMPLVVGLQHGRDNSPSVDRIDSARGYVRGNVTVISARANRLKGDGRLAEHKQIVEWLGRVGAP